MFLSKRAPETIKTSYVITQTITIVVNSITARTIIKINNSAATTTTKYNHSSNNNKDGTEKPAYGFYRFILCQ